jgi:hypothetical protein
VTRISTYGGIELSRGCEKIKTMGHGAQTFHPACCKCPRRVPIVEKRINHILQSRTSQQEHPARSLTHDWAMVDPFTA